MKIAIIGHGNVGGALARNWAGRGHEILIGVRRDQDEKAQALAQVPGITIAPQAEAVAAADVILYAAPATAAPDVAAGLGDLTGKVLIDASNAIRKRPEPYATAFHVFAEQTAAELVKCFNTTGFENMANPVYELANPQPHPVALDMFMAGDSARAKSVARQLALDAGFGVCYDFGGSDQVLLLEQFALAWINLAIMQGHGRGIGFKVLNRVA